MREARRNSLLTHRLIRSFAADKFVRTPRPTTKQIMEHYVNRAGETLAGLDPYTRELFIRCCCSLSEVYNRQFSIYQVIAQSSTAELTQAA